MKIETNFNYQDIHKSQKYRKGKKEIAKKKPSRN